MGPAVALAGLLAFCLLLFGVTMRRTGRMARRPVTPIRLVVPWVVAGVAIVAIVLVVIPGVPPVVILGLVTYTAVAVTATWRMASLDRASAWMPPSQRAARLGITAFALTWLGLVLGLLLRIADLLAGVRSAGPP
jgi:hypothetical protein